MSKIILSVLTIAAVVQAAFSFSEPTISNSLDPVFVPNYNTPSTETDQRKSLVVVQVEPMQRGSVVGQTLFRVLASDQGELGTIKIDAYWQGSRAYSVDKRAGDRQYKPGDILIGYGAIVTDKSLQRMINEGIDLEDASRGVTIADNVILQADFLLKSDPSWASQERLSAQPVYHTYLDNLQYGSFDVQRTALFFLAELYRSKYEHSNPDDLPNLNQLNDTAQVLGSLGVRPEAKLELEYLKVFVDGLIQRHRGGTLKRNQEYANELVRLAEDGISVSEGQRISGMPFFTIAPPYSLDTILPDLYSLGVSWSPSSNHPINYEASVSGLAALLRTPRPKWQTSDSAHEDLLVWLAALMSGDSSLQRKVLQFTYSDKTRSESEVEAHYDSLAVALQQLIGSP
jgi:hypothetical protein